MVRIFALLHKTIKISRDFAGAKSTEKTRRKKMRGCSFFNEELFKMTLESLRVIFKKCILSTYYETSHELKYQIIKWYFCCLCFNSLRVTMRTWKK